MNKIKVVNHDMIITSKNGFSANIPKGRSLDHLRYVNGKIIDITDLNEFHVEKKNGVFVLHAAKFPGTQLVKMRYKDRKKLYLDKKTGKIKIKTEREEHNDKIRQQRKCRYPEIGDQLEAILEYLKTKNNLPMKLKKIIKDIDNIKKTYTKYD